jgi:hypothetical protein
MSDIAQSVSALNTVLDAMMQEDPAHAAEYRTLRQRINAGEEQSRYRSFGSEEFQMLHERELDTVSSKPLIKY